MIMGPITSANSIMQIIFAQLIFVTVINAEYWSYSNATNYDSLGKSERLKRAPFHRYVPPDTLRATIKDGNKEIHLTWQRSNRYLFNKHLPVYTTRMNSWGPNHKKHDVMKHLGNTIIYHDLTHKSAIMYVENLDSITGVVGRNLVILNLPLDRLSQPLVVGDGYVSKMPFRTHGDNKRLRPSSRHPAIYAGRHRTNPKEVISPPSQNQQDTVPQRFYVETLLFVTHDVVQLMRSQYNKRFVMGAVINCLYQFNAVDMVFATLPRNDFEIYINLAGIIIEEDDSAFSEVTMYPPLKYDGNDDLDISHIFEQFQRYPEHFDFPFAKNSFDLIFIVTGRTLKLGSRQPKGWYAIVHDIFEKRRQNNDRTYVPMAIASSYNAFSSHCVVAHEIGKILGIKENDPIHKGTVKNGILQCYGIMQSSVDHCSECIKWSDESVRQLKVFMSENRNRCFLLNEPRSLLTPGTPVMSVTPCRQCTCFGYSSYSEETPLMCPFFIKDNSCGEPLQCKLPNSEDGLRAEPTILPLDGTPCGENKVCWDEKCKNLS